jgi:hypothetical protein
MSGYCRLALTLLVLVAVLPARLAAAPAEAKPKAAVATPAGKPKPRITISKETTYLVGPLRPDGYVDYVAALNAELGRGVTPENNAVVPLMVACGPTVVSEKQRAAFFELLGVPVPPEKGSYFVSIYRYVQYLHGQSELPGMEKRASTPLDPKECDEAEAECAQAQKRPWSREEFPTVAGWLDVNREPLRLIGEAGRRPRFYAPLVPCGEPPMITVLLPVCDAPRSAIRLLAAHAMLRLHEGKLDEAWQDLLACHRLARQVGQGTTLVEGLVAFVIERTAVAGEAAVAHYGRPSAATIRQMKADLAALPPMRKMADRIDHGERFFGLDAAATVARKGLSEIDNITGFGTTSGKHTGLLEQAIFAGLDATIDWDEPLRILNRWYDRLAAAARKPTRAERAAAMAECEKQLKALAAGVRDIRRIPERFLEKPPGQTVGRWLGEVLVALLLPAINAVTRAEDRSATETKLAEVALDLAAYRADHGKYPEQLAELKPKYRAEIKDPFSDSELRYRRDGEGFLLYSVGPNGKDDGGRNLSDYPERPPEAAGWDDIAIHMPVRPRKR